MVQEHQDQGILKTVVPVIGTDYKNSEINLNPVSQFTKNPLIPPGGFFIAADRYLTDKPDDNNSGSREFHICGKSLLHAMDIFYHQLIRVHHYF